MREFIRILPNSAVYVFFFFSIFFPSFSFLYADTVYLKNGDTLEGIIRTEDKTSLLIDLGYGTVVFSRGEIEKIVTSSPEESEKVFENWTRQRADALLKKSLAAEEREKAMIAWREKQAQAEVALKISNKNRPQDVSLVSENGQLVVKVVLNGTVPASLIIDTGSSLVLLTRKLADRLSLGASSEKEATEIQVADGRKLKARRVTLQSLKAGETEVENIEAAVLFEEDGSTKGMHDGLLGMSFLGRFSFSIDQEGGKLILVPKK